MRKLPPHRRIFWQCFFGYYCVGLHQLLPIKIVSCLDNGSDFDLITRESGICFCTVERPGATRENWVGSGIDLVFRRRGPEIGSLLSSHPADDWLVTSTPASPLLESFCRDRGLAYIGPKPENAVPFQHKSALHRAACEIGLPNPNGRWVSPDSFSYPDLRHAYGDRFVLQRGLGSAGSGTYLVESRQAAETILRQWPDQQIYICPYLGDLSLNINAAVIGRNVCVGFPNVQLSGVRELGTPWGGYCGNDYSAAAEMDPALIERVQEFTERLGGWLASQGFEGLFGVDFVIDETNGLPFAVDLNPRSQGSTVVSTQAELQDGRLPLAAAELGYRCGLLTGSELRARIDQFRKPLRGAQLCLRSPSSAPHAIPSDVPPGIYRVEETMEFSQPGIGLGECRSPEDWLLTCGVPRLKTLVQPGAWLVRLFSNDTVSEGKSSQLNSRALKVSLLTYQLFGFDPPWIARRDGTR